MINRQFVSQIRSMHKLLSGDNIINDRTILREGKGVAASMIRRDLNLRKLWNTDTIFTTIPCFEMKEVNLADCCSYQSKETVSRSVHKLPKITEGIFNYTIQGVFDTGLSKKLDYTEIARWINLKNIGVPAGKVFYWIHDGYMFCSSPYVKTLKVVASFIDDIPQEVMYPDCECSSSAGRDECVSPMDEEFKCPEYLLFGAIGSAGVMPLVRDNLLRTYFAVGTDKTSDNQEQLK